MNEEEMCNLLGKALDLEEEGRKFYSRCAQQTKDENGAEMFRYLAREEISHYNRVAELFKTYLNQGYCNYLASRDDREESGVFQDHVAGGKMSEKSDMLDALNMGISAEKKSIELYQMMLDDAQGDEVAAAIQKIADEETKHLQMLETEVEFVTKTGDFTDFKQVTS